MTLGQYIATGAKLGTAIFVIALAEPSASGEEPLKITVDKASSGCAIAADDLASLFPRSLVEYTFMGEPRERTKGSVFILSLKDTLGLAVDSSAEPGTLVFVAFSTGNSIVKLYERSAAGLTERWSSGVILGETTLKLDDLNGDGRAEVLVLLVPNTRGYGGLFVLSYESGQVRVLNPSGKASGFSEFKGLLDIVKSESGANISAYHPNEGVRRSYYYAKESSRIELVSENPMDSDRE